MASRDPEATREHLVQAAFQEVYEKGVKGTSMDAVLERTRVTKGALYHHFDGKKALCRAVIDEVVRPMVLSQWVSPLAGTTDPIAAVKDTLRRAVDSHCERTLQHGCPLNNLAQEVSGADGELRAEVQRLYADWIGALRDALSRGQGAGKVRADVEPEAIARFVVGAIEGAITLGKASRDAKVFAGNLEMLAAYLDWLRPVARPRRRR